MKKFFASLDKWSYKLVTIFLGIAMVALTAIVNIQVIARYVLKVSIGGVEELPVYLMIVSVWLAAIFVARNDAHFKIDLLDMVVKNKRVLAGLKVVLKLITFVVISIFAVLSFKYVHVTWQMGDVTAGLRIPLWILQGVIPLSTAFMALYYGIQIFKDAKAVIKWHL